MTRTQRNAKQRRAKARRNAARKAGAVLGWVGLIAGTIGFSAVLGYGMSL